MAANRRSGDGRQANGSDDSGAVDGGGGAGGGATAPSRRCGASEVLAAGWLRRPRGREAWVRGSCGDISVPRLAIVGSRAPSAAQARAAAAMAEAAVAAGWAVWSGGADGVDAIAHRTTMRVGGHTVAVLPAGVEPPTPPRHGPLFAQIAVRGGLLAAGPDFAPLRNGAYRERNVTLVAAVDALLVVCAGERSGSLHAAGCARKAGLPLAALPWSPGEANAEGAWSLLDAGARCVATPALLARWLQGLAPQVNADGATEGAAPHAGLVGLPRAAAGPGCSAAGQRSALPLFAAAAGRRVAARAAAAVGAAPSASEPAAVPVSPSAIDGDGGGWQRYAAAAPATPSSTVAVAALTALQWALLRAVVAREADGLDLDARPPGWERGATAALLLELALEGLVAADRYGRHRATPAGLRAAERDPA